MPARQHFRPADVYICTLLHIHMFTCTHTHTYIEIVTYAHVIYLYVNQNMLTHQFMRFRLQRVEDYAELGHRVTATELS